MDLCVEQLSCRCHYCIIYTNVIQTETIKISGLQMKKCLLLKVIIIHQITDLFNVSN